MAGRVRRGRGGLWYPSLANKPTTRLYKSPWESMPLFLVPSLKHGIRLSGSVPLARVMGGIAWHTPRGWLLHVGFKQAGRRPS
jgi:hypothetical protein